MTAVIVSTSAVIDRRYNGLVCSVAAPYERRSVVHSAVIDRRYRRAIANCRHAAASP
jgi:hypothetical protein